VRRDELPLYPLLRGDRVLSSERRVLIVTQVRDHSVVAINYGDTPLEIGYGDVASALVEVAREPQVFSHHAHKLSIEAEELEAMIPSIGYEHCRQLCAGVDPDAMRLL
jgi:hypothetical protein